MTTRRFEAIGHEKHPASIFECSGMMVLIQREQKTYGIQEIGHNNGNNTITENRDLRMSGLYNGIEPAVRWLRRLEYDLSDQKGQDRDILPSKYVSTFAMLLVGKAATWAESTPEVQTIFGKACPGRLDVLQLKALIKQEFPVDDIVASKALELQLITLHQEEKESLMDYYKRTAKLLIDFGGRESTEAGPPLSRIEKNVSAMVARLWVTGLKDKIINAKMSDTLAISEMSLIELYRLAEGIAQSEIAKQQQHISKQKEEEFEFYRRIACGQTQRYHAGHDTIRRHSGRVYRLCD